MTKKKHILNTALFGVLLLLLLTVASAMMNPTKWFDEKLIQDRNARTVQMMEQPAHTIDVMNIGDSLSTAGFTPMELWRQQGITSFNIGADGLCCCSAMRPARTCKWYCHSLCTTHFRFLNTTISGKLPSKAPGS